MYEENVARTFMEKLKAILWSQWMKKKKKTKMSLEGMKKTTF